MPPCVPFLAGYLPRAWEHGGSDMTQNGRQGGRLWRRRHLSGDRVLAEAVQAMCAGRALSAASEGPWVTPVLSS